MSQEEKLNVPRESASVNFKSLVTSYEFGIKPSYIKMFPSVLKGCFNFTVTKFIEECNRLMTEEKVPILPQKKAMFLDLLR